MGLTQEALGKRINRHEKTVANIYKRATIDTGLLTDISAAIGYDFFQHYYEEEPLKSLHQGGIKEWQDKVEARNQTIKQLQQEIENKQKYINSQEDVIALLKEREQLKNK